MGEGVVDCCEKEVGCYIGLTDKKRLTDIGGLTGGRGGVD